MRLPDWEDRLNAVLDASAYLPHSYGKHDCVLFCSRAVEAMTGVDFAAEARGTYRSAAGSVRAMKRFGAGTLAATLTSFLGEPQPVAWAHRGDIVLFNGVPGILQANHGVFVGGDDADLELATVGLVRIPRTLLDRASSWSVPF